MFPCTKRVGGTGRRDKTLALVKKAHASQRVRKESRIKKGNAGYQVRTANSERT
jgi:hypothetical protein